MSEASFVYFIRPVGMEGPVKIGSSGMPEARLRPLMAISPFPLEIAARIYGRKDLEIRFHAKFVDQRSHLEWFHPSAELTATIDAINAGTFDINTLPAGRKLPGVMAQCVRLGASRRLSRGLIKARGMGVLAPSHVEAARATLYRAADDAEWERAAATVETYLQDPLLHGSPAPGEWAEEARAKHRARRAEEAELRARAGKAVSA